MAITKSANLTRFDRWGSQLGRVRALDAPYSVATDGTDNLTVSTFDCVDKGERLVWMDEDTGEWHEHEVIGTRRVHDTSGRAVTEATCINSICELYDDDFPARTLPGSSPASAISAALYQTNWALGTCDVGGTFDFEFEDMSVREALARIREVVGEGEYQTVVTVGSEGVTRRTLNFLVEVGAGQGRVRHRFTYGKGARSVERTVGQEEVYTAVRATGAEILDNDGHGTGQHYSVTVYDDVALQSWGRPDAMGNPKHSYMRYQDSGCDDVDYLRMQAAKALANSSSPNVTYRCEAPDVGTCRLGDYVDVVDKGFEPPLRLRARMTRIEKNLMGQGRSGVVEFGTRPNYLVRAFDKADQTSPATREAQERLRGIDASLDEMGSSIGAIDAELEEIGTSIEDISTSIGDIETDLGDIQTAFGGDSLADVIGPGYDLGTDGSIDSRLGALERGGGVATGEAPLYDNLASAVGDPSAALDLTAGGYGGSTMDFQLDVDYILYSANPGYDHSLREHGLSVDGQLNLTGWGTSQAYRSSTLNLLVHDILFMRLSDDINVTDDGELLLMAPYSAWDSSRNRGSTYRPRLSIDKESIRLEGNGVYANSRTDRAEVVLTGTEPGISFPRHGVELRVRDGYITLTHDGSSGETKVAVSAETSITLRIGGSSNTFLTFDSSGLSCTVNGNRTVLAS